MMKTPTSGPRTLRGVCLAGFVMLSCAACLRAQESRFGTRSELVLIPVTITDLAGGTVNGIEPSELAVFDNGKARKVNVDTLETGIAPIALMIAVQSSGISAAALENIGKIAPMIQPLVVGERGCAGLIAFAESATVLQDCTKDQDAVGRAFRALRPAGHAEACMLDAVSVAVERLRLHANARRVLLLISESRDRSSENSLETAVVAAQSAGVTVYAATYSVFKTALISKVQISQPRRPDRPPQLNPNIGTKNGLPAGPRNPRTPDPKDGVDLLAGMTELARLDKANTTQVLTTATGGTTFRFTGRKALEEAISGLGAELHSQYLLSFVPEPAATGYHRLEVRLIRPEQYRIRARLGYWSSEPPH